MITMPGELDDMREARLASMISPDENEKMIEVQKASEDLEWKRLSSFFKKVFDYFKKK